jgi:hypothetical protein
VHRDMRRKYRTRTLIQLHAPTPAMDDLAPRFEALDFHNNASNISNQAQQQAIYGGQHNYL